MADPWGSTAVSAMRWAFGMLGRSATLPIALGSLRGPSGPRYDLSRLDLAAQAAIIRMEVDRMDNPVAKSYLWASFIPRPMLERQPGRQAREMVDRFPELRSHHVHNIAWWLLCQEGTGVHRIRGYQEIVAQFTCGEESIERLRRLLACSPAKATETRRRNYERLEGLRDRSLALIEARLYEVGIIQDLAAAQQGGQG